MKKPPKKSRKIKSKRINKPNNIEPTSKIELIKSDTNITKSISVVLTFLGFVATAMGIVTFIHGEWRGVNIHPNAGNTEDPFTATFVVNNPALFVSVDEGRFECEVLFVKSKSANGSMGGIFMANNKLASNSQFSLKPGDSAQIPCQPFATIHIEGGHYEQSAEIAIKLKYKTLGIVRQTISQNFNWDEKARQWTEGPVIP